MDNIFNFIFRAPGRVSWSICRRSYLGLQTDRLRVGKAVQNPNPPEPKPFPIDTFLNWIIGEAYQIKN